MSIFDSARYFPESKNGQKVSMTIMFTNTFFEKSIVTNRKKSKKAVRVGSPFFGSMVRLPKRGKKGEQSFISKTISYYHAIINVIKCDNLTIIKNTNKYYRKGGELVLGFHVIILLIVSITH
jgi:hypothetical protein